VPFLDQSEVKGTEVAIIADPQEAHQAVNLPSIRGLRGLMLEHRQVEFLPIALEAAGAVP
jgi:hypothetical protein